MNRDVKSILKCFFASITLFTCIHLQAQPPACKKETVLSIDFGSGRSPQIDLSFLRNYRPVNSSCPNDGYFTFTPYTSDCFGGHWITVPEDHTPGDMSGNMMLVNASEQPGEFFSINIKGLKGSTRYELSAWLLNVCQRTVGCRTLYPNIEFIVGDVNGKLISKFHTGELPADKAPIWRRYFAGFTTPAVVGDVILILYNRSDGGCGNDFAMDDILLTWCEPIKPEAVKQETKQVATPISEKKPIIPKQEKKDTAFITRTTQPVVIPPVSKPVVKDLAKMTRPEPMIFKTRSNPVVKQIFTDSAELTIEIYDNGVIDGDTVSIYHNNELIMANAALLAKPIRLTIKVDAQHPHHELVMVANNLGSIPPNTSLMIVTAKDKRYQVFISSDDKKNARVVIDLEQ